MKGYVAKSMNQTKSLTQQSLVGIAGFIDVETTGLNPDRDEVIELSLILFSFDRSTGQVLEIVDEYSGLREPSVSISRQATSVHGLTKQKLKGNVLDNQKIIEMITKAEFLIAHNAKFDRGFVKRLFPAANRKKWHCSMDDIDWRGMGFQSKGLQNLLSDHGIQVMQAHRALEDVRGGIMLLSKQSKSGEYYLQQLIAKKEKSRTKLSEPLPAAVQSAASVAVESETAVKIAEKPDKMKPLTALVFLFAPIAGGFTGGIFGFLGGLAVSFYLYKRHNKKQKQKQ